MARDKLDDAEQDAFATAMDGVRPLRQDRLPPEPIWRPITTISEREQAVLRTLDQLVAGEIPLAPEGNDELIQGAVPDLDRRIVKQLARGEFTIQAELDLHGLDSTAARERLEQFVLDAHARQLRCIKVVHGRGKRSPGGVAVLKSQLPRWLARGPARLLVLAFTSAPAHDGGGGATYVLLRRARARPA